MKRPEQTPATAHSLTSQLVLSKFTQSGTDNWVDNDTSGKLKEGRDFAGKLTILSTDTGAFSAKLSSLSNTFDNSFTGGGTQVATFKVTSKAGATETPLNDSLVVSKADADTLNGYAGKDKIIGAVGNDTLTGGAGLDTLTGGAGADVFVFSAGDSGVTTTTLDSVTDFSSTQGDKIQLTGLSTKSLR
ncbi:MAG: hypothetical protein RIR18_302 [Pseudomonadota bacterium]